MYGASPWTRGVFTPAEVGRTRESYDTAAMLIVDGTFNLTEASRQAELELRDAPAIARLPTNAMPPFNNVNRHKRVNELSLGFCQGRCGYNASQNFTMQEPSGCMGRRGLSLRLRHKWLACPPLEAQDCLMISIGIGMEWDFELQLAARGCEVHAFDPTIGLHAAHRQDGRRPSEDVSTFALPLPGVG